MAQAEAAHLRASNTSESETKWKKYITYIRIALLTVWWIIILVLIILKGSVDPVKTIVSISEDIDKDLPMKDLTPGQNVRISVEGPISVPKFDYVLSASMRPDREENNVITLELQVVTKDADGNIGGRQSISNQWTLEIVDDKHLRTVKMETRAQMFNLKQFDANQNNQETVLHLVTNADKLVSFAVSFDFNPFMSSIAFLISLMLLLVYFFLLMFDVVHRTLIAMLISCMSIAILGVVHSRPTIYEMLEWMDMEIFMIQFGMAIVVTFLLRTGVYDWLAVRAFKMSRGQVWPFLYVSIGAVFLLALFFENSGVVLVIGPFFLIVCQMLSVSVIPVVIIITAFLLCGKIGLPYSSILNRRVCKHPFLVDNEITHAVYSYHCMPFCLVIVLSTFCYLRWVYRDPTKIAVQETEADALKRVIRVLDDTAHGMTGYTRSERNVMTQLQNKKVTLQDRLKNLGKMPKPVENFEEKLQAYHSKLGIKNKWLLIACAFPIAFIIICSIVNWSTKDYNIGWFIILAAFFLIIIVGEHDLEDLLYHVDWPTLIFMASQQVFTKALDKLSFDDTIGKFTRQIILSSEDNRLMVAIVVVFCMSTISAIVLDNIGVAKVLVNIVSILSLDNNLQLPLRPLIWSMLFGLHVGSMGTQVSSLTCIVFCGLVQRHGVRFPFFKHFKICFPLMLLNAIVSICYLLVVHVAFDIS